MKLSIIASIYSGLSFREKVTRIPEGDVGVVQLRNLSNDYSSIDTDLDRIADNGIKTKYFLSEGNILLVGKGGNNHAVIVNSEINKMVASSSFFIIKIKTDNIKPHYLHWYLNSSLAQNELKKQQSGTYTPTLKISALQELEIPVPPVATQMNIGKIYQLQLREKRLQNQLIDKR